MTDAALKRRSSTSLPESRGAALRPPETGGYTVEERGLVIPGKSRALDRERYAANLRRELPSIPFAGNRAVNLAT